MQLVTYSENMNFIQLRVKRGTLSKARRWHQHRQTFSYMNSNNHLQQNSVLYKYSTTKQLSCSLVIKHGINFCTYGNRQHLYICCRFTNTAPNQNNGNGSGKSCQMRGLIDPLYNIARYWQNALVNLSHLFNLGHNT